MKSKLDIELIGVASVQASPSRELKESTGALLPKTKSVIVLGKEIYKEVVSLLKPSKEAGEAESGELLRVHSDYLSGRSPGQSVTSKPLSAKRLSFPSFTSSRAF